MTVNILLFKIAATKSVNLIGKDRTKVKIQTALSREDTVGAIRSMNSNRAWMEISSSCVFPTILREMIHTWSVDWPFSMRWRVGESDSESSSFSNFPLSCSFVDSLSKIDAFSSLVFILVEHIQYPAREIDSSALLEVNLKNVNQ